MGYQCEQCLSRVTSRALVVHPSEYASLLVTGGSPQLDSGDDR